MINGANLKVQTTRVKSTQTNFTGSTVIKEEGASKKNCCQTNCLSKLTQKILDCSCCITELFQQFSVKKLEFGDSEWIIRP